MRPYTCPDQLGEGEVATWAPSSSTLISGPTEGILIDALLTFENAEQIAAWAKSFGKKIVVAGHKSVGAADLPENLAASQRYLRDFTTLAKKSGTMEDLVHGMLELHRERDQPHTLWISARAEVARRARTAALGQLRRTD
jgi:hypothetical protein